MHHPDPDPHSIAKRAATPETARLLADTIPFHIQKGNHRVEATYSARNGIVTVRHQGESLSTYSPDADHKAVALKLLNVMLTI